MRRTFSRVLTSSLMVALLLMVWMPAAAQTTLAPEQVATLERALTAGQTVYGYQSFMIESRSEQAQALSIVGADGVAMQENNLAETSETLGAIVRGANPNGFYAEIRTSEENGNAYTLQGELRYVDGVLYGEGKYLEGVSSYVFPQGFNAIADPTNPLGLDVFEPQAFLDTVNAVPTESPLNNLTTLQTIATDVTFQQGDLEGTPEIITVTIGLTGLLPFIQAQSDEETANPVVKTLLSYASPESQAVMTLYIDQTGRLLQTENSLSVILVDLAATTVDPTAPAGAVVNMTLTQQESTTYSNINAVTEMVGAPTIG